MSAAPNGENPQAAAAMQMIVQAVISGDASIVPQAVNAGLNISGIRGPHGMNLLHMAAGSGHGDVVEALLSAGLDPQEPMDHGFLPIDLAREEGHADVVRLLERRPEQAEPAPASGQKTAENATQMAAQRASKAAEACENGDLAALRSLVAGPGDPVLTMTTPEGASLLHAAVAGESADVVTFLVEQGIDLQARMKDHVPGMDTDGPYTALDFARILRNKAAVPILEEACDAADGGKGIDGETFMVKAMRKPDGGLYVGVFNKYTGDRAHRTLAERAEKQVKEQQEEREQQEEQGGASANKGASANTGASATPPAPAEPRATPTAPVEQRVLLGSEKHLYGTPVDDLVDHWKPGQSRVMARLRKSWADAKRRVADEQAAKDAMNGKPPAPVPSSPPEASLAPEAPQPADATVQVLDAISSGDHTTLERLLRDDPALAQFHEDGLTLLHLAADKRNPQVVRVLLDAGLDPQAASHDGITALDLAHAAGHRDVIALLDPTMNASVPAAQEDPVDEQPASASEGERFERLAEACAAGDLATVQTLVNEDDTSLLDVKESSGAVALHFAVLSDDPRTVGYLIALRPDGDGLNNLMTMPLRHRPEDQGGPYSPLDLARVLQKDAAGAVLEMACESLGIDGETNHVIAMYGPDGTPHVKVLNRFTKTPVHPGMAERIAKAVVQKMMEERGG